MTSLQERLFAMQDKHYAAFQAKLTPGVPVESFIGIRVPVLRKFAKEFTKEKECVLSKMLLVSRDSLDTFQETIWILLYLAVTIGCVD